VFTRFPVLFASCFLSLAAACGAEGDCEKVVDHLTALAAKSANVAEDKKVLAEAERAKQLQQCKKEGITKKQERCILATTALEELSQCDRR
jgi:hypothetical protein